MKRITASDARRRWFQILDSVASGEVVMIERKGRRIVLRREDASGDADDLPDYSALIRPIADVDRAEDWGWEWTDDGGLHPRPGDGE